MPHQYQGGAHHYRVGEPGMNRPGVVGMSAVSKALVITDKDGNPIDFSRGKSTRTATTSPVIAVAGVPPPPPPAMYPPPRRMASPPSNPRCRRLPPPRSLNHPIRARCYAWPRRTPSPLDQRRGPARRPRRLPHWKSQGREVGTSRRAAEERAGEEEERVTPITYSPRNAFLNTSSFGKTQRGIEEPRRRSRSTDNGAPKTEVIYK